MRKKWVIINIETKAREFHSKVLLSYYLVRQGYGVILFFSTNIKSVIADFPKGVYIDRNMWLPSRGKLIRLIKKNGFIYYCLDEEGLVYFDKNVYLNRVPEKNFKLVDKFLCNGKEQYSIVKEKYPKDSKKIVITGNPRFDLLKERFNLFEKKTVKKISKKYHPFFLIVSNFSPVNHMGAPKEKEKRLLYTLDKAKRQGFISSEKDEKERYQRLIHINNIFESFQNVIKKISKKYPNHNIIIRPHPSEGHDIWENLAQKNKNVHVVFEDTLTSWIKASSLVIQNSCTSAIESLYLNTPCLSYRPFVNEKFDQPLPNKVAVNAFNEKELFKEINLLLHDQEYYREQTKEFFKILDKHLDSNDEKLNVEKITDLITKEQITEQQFFPNIFKIKQKLKNKLRINLKIKFAKIIIDNKSFFSKIFSPTIMDCIEKEVQQRLFSKKYMKHKSGIMTEKEIETIFKQLNTINHKKNIPKVKQLDTNQFLMYE
jgi:surface carbohydrate biosynthesis protein